MENIGIKKAAAINFISKYMNIFVQLIINSVLARLLTPDDYGIVAIINVFISFFAILADMGIGPAVIQHKELSDRQISDIFIFTLFTAILSSIVFALFCYPMSIFYNNSIYIKLGKILSVSIFFNVLNIVPNAIILKNKKFKELGIRNIIITIIGGIITIYLAIRGAKYYSLVINSILVSAMTFSFNFHYSNIKISRTFSFKSIQLIKDFSIYQFGFNFINYFSRNLDNLLIGKIMGSVYLGYYDKAYKLMLYPVQNLTHVITPVMHPILSDFKDQKEIIYDKYLKIMKLLAHMGIFISIFCFFAPGEIITIMFGEQWLESVSIFRILSLSIIYQMTLSSTGSVFQATGSTKYMFKCGTFSTVIMVSSILIGTYSKNLNLLAMCLVICFIINFIQTYYILVRKVFDKSFIKFLQSFKDILIIGCAMILINFVFLKFILYNSSFYYENILISFILKLIITSIGYVIGTIMTGKYKYILRKVGILS